MFLHFGRKKCCNVVVLYGNIIGMILICGHRSGVVITDMDTVLYNTTSIGYNW